MHGTKVEIAFGRDVSDVDWDAELFAQGVDLGGGFGVVDGSEAHVDVGEVGGMEGTVVVGDDVALDTVGDFGVKPAAGGDDSDFGVGVEEGEDAAGSDLVGALAKEGIVDLGPKQTYIPAPNYKNFLIPYLPRYN